MEATRRAVIDDLDRLVELLHQAHAETPDVRGGTLYGHPERSVGPRQRLEALLGADDVSVLCGSIDGYTVGLAIVSTRSFAATKIGIIEELYVEPPMREVGVGEALLDSATQWCKSKDCSGVDVTALPGDRSMKNLCERSGYSARMLVMHKSI